MMCVHRPDFSASAILLALALLAPSEASAQADAASAGTPPETADTANADEAPPASPTPTEGAAAVEDEAESADAPNFGWTASVFTRPEIRAGYDRIGLADTDFVRYRFRVGVTLEPMSLGRVRLGGRFVPQAAGFWASGATLTDPALGIHEAVMTLHAGSARLEVGRFEMSYGEELIIGTVGWHQVGRAFDGARLRFDLRESGANVDVFATHLFEALPNELGDADRTFSGVYASLGPLFAEALALDLYALSLLAAENDGAGTPRNHVLTLGARYRQSVGRMRLRAEAGAQLHNAEGTSTRLAGQADVEVGMQAGERLGVSLEGLIASGANGDIAAWNHLFPTAHKWLGFNDIIGPRANIASGVAHARVRIADGWSARADLHVFARPRAAGGAPAGYSGLEADLGARWVIAPGLALRGNYSLFVPNDDAWGAGRAAHFAELELRYTR